jgi:hypothetical protein
MRIRRVITIVAATAAAAALVGSAVAYANAGDEGDAGDTAGAADGAAATDHPDHDRHEAGEGREAGEDDGGGDGAHDRRDHRDHPRLAPYDERYAAASAGEQAAADELRDQVTATLAAYADLDAALAAGYREPPRGDGPLRHYLNRALVRDGDVLDPEQPEGLVYYEIEGRAPQLLGAFFVTPPGAEAPQPAGDLVVWHSHDPACPDLFVTEDEPCAGVRRMLHVWTADTATVTRRRNPERTVDVRIADPFGTPFRAAIERAGTGGRGR